MQSQRITKKYCSDNCKQLAFYKRYGSQLAAATGNEPLNGKLVASNDKDTGDAADQFNDTTLPAVKNEPEEPPYQWVYPGILEKIDAYLENSEEADLFLFPEQSWGAYRLPAIKWVSLRLRCLLESLIRMSHLPHIDYATLVAVKRAFDQLIAARHFKSLPPNYPYTGLIQELHQKITAITGQCKAGRLIQFRLPLHRKASLIAQRYILAGFVAPLKFSELDFKE